MRLNSFKFKISLTYAFLVGTMLVLYSLFIYWGISTTLFAEFDKELRNKAQATVKVVELYVKAVGKSPQLIDYVFNRISFPEDIDVRLELIARIDFYWAQQFDKLNMQDDLMLLRDANGEIVGKSRRLSTELAQAIVNESAVPSGGDLQFSTVYFKNRILRVVSLPMKLEGDSGYILQVATSQKPIIRVLQGRLTAILAGIPLVFALTMLLGWLFVNQMLKPVMKVTKTAETLSHKDLSARLERPQDDAEMQRLVDAFNDMIGRLEKAFRHIEEFSSQVAHELRTPLAIMKGESELALRKDRSSVEYQRAIKVNLEEIDRMLRTIDDLLLLAKIDYRPEIFKKENFELNAFVREVFEQAKILGEKKGVSISFDLPAAQVSVLGDRLHLRRMFYNLIHNAVKFTPAGGAVHITTSLKDRQVLTMVADSGCGISEADLPKVFDRFFHRANPESNEEPGSGLGLNIALAIARAHGGDIKAESRSGKGSTFTVILPTTI